MVLGTVIGMAAVLAAGTEEIPTGFEQIAKITPTSSATGGHLGNSVDIYENILIVGAPYQGGDSYGRGYAQVAAFSEWGGGIAETIDLSASDGVDGDLFGMRVAIGAVEGSTGEGGVAYVSAPGRGGDCASSCGAVYVFSGDGESEIDILTPGDGDALRAFGFDLSFDGASLAVGAPYDSEAGEALHGAVYVYTLGPDGVPTHEERVVFDHPVANQFFGWSVSINGDRMAVGAIEGTGGPGAVYIFDRQPDDSWSQTDEVVAAGGTDGDWFGTDVTLVDDVLITSAINYQYGEGEDAKTNIGQVYVFKWDGDSFEEVQQILPPIMESHMAWGVSVDFDGEHLVIGSNGWQNNGEESTGAAAVYDYGPDGQFIGGRVFIGSDVASFAKFGTAVALHGERAIIGAKEEDIDDGGAAYVFSPRCGGDLVDGEGGSSADEIDTDDIFAIVENWGTTGITTHDVVQDFDVNIHDLLIVLQYYGSCG